MRGDTNEENHNIPDAAAVPFLTFTPNTRSKLISENYPGNKLTSFYPCFLVTPLISNVRFSH